ncbi:MAG: hydroxyacid dehydrogenase [Candidatus Micrarchaeota archaeon]|nr:hydroxyacid dehydrogenase [Candidatus Micrarchaeota archaeon]
MNIVIADKMEPEVVAEIKKLGNCTVTPAAADLPAALANADALIVRSATKVTAELLTHASKLKIVARAGVGTDNIDKPACEKRKIKVINTPAASTNAVAELALGMMFAAARRIPKADAGMKAKKWLKKELTGTEIQGKTLGVIGLGRIGTSLALKAHSIGMNILYYDPHAQSAPAVGKGVSLDELMASADYISLHVPATPETTGMINAAAISKMKKTAVIVNTARGALIDEEALYSALKEGRMGCACLDVYPSEPYSGKLCELENVVLTPHIAGSTAEAQMRIGLELIEKLKAELK